MSKTASSGDYEIMSILPTAKWWLLCSVLPLAACGDDGGGPHGGSGSTLKSKIDVSHTIGFAIAMTGSSPRVPGLPPPPADCMPSTLYAVQDDGSMLITTVTETVNEMDASVCSTNMQLESARAVYDTAKYVVIQYMPNLVLNDPTGNVARQCGYVVMRKSDGALFCDERMSENTLREIEGPNDKLYFHSPNMLVRVDMATTPPMETVVDDGMVTGDFIEAMDVDAMDNALVWGGFGVRIYKANGGLQNISASQAQCQWLDPNGSFYYGTSYIQTPNQPARTIISRLSTDTYTPTPVGQMVSSNSQSPACTIALAAGPQTLAYSLGAPKLIEVVSATGMGQCWKDTGTPTGTCTADSDCDGTCTTSTSCGGGMCCVGGGHPNRPCSQPSDCAGTCITAGTEHPISGITMLKDAVGLNGKVFVRGTDSAGNGAVIQVDVPGFAQTTLLAPGVYTLSAISLSANGELTFAGLRNNDGARVIGNCDAGGCTVLNATAPAVSSLVRIN